MGFSHNKKVPLVRFRSTILVLSGLSALTSLIFQFLVIRRIGIGLSSDALVIGTLLPQFFLIIISSPITSILIPQLVAEDSKSRKGLYFGLLSAALITATILAVIFFVTTPLYIGLITKDSSPESRALIIKLARIQIWGLIPYAAIAIQRSYNLSRESFYKNEISLLVPNIVFVVFLFYYQTDIQTLAYIYVFKAILQFIFLMAWDELVGTNPIVVKVKMLEFFSKIKIPMMVSIYLRSGSLIERAILANSPAGSLTTYNLCQQIMLMIGGATESSILNPYFVNASSLYKSGLRGEHKLNLSGHILKLFFGLSCLFIILRSSLQEVLFYAEKSGIIRTSEYSNILLIFTCLAGVFIFGSLGQLINFSLYSIGRAKEQSIIMGITYAVFTLAKVLSFFTWGIVGLCIVVSLSFMADFVILYYYYLKYIGLINTIQKRAEP